MKKQITAILAVVLGVVAYNLFLTPGAENFDPKGKIARDFERRRHIVNNEKYFQFFDGRMSSEQEQAMQFLYAYMPLPDIADYPAEYHLQNVDYALKARAEMPWGKSVPTREFLHFVLPVRVNNENMDTSRAVFYNELKERVKGLSMHDAVLEVNHWCHEKVTYTPSDIRTSSPLATVRTAYGRCGEESTFTVAALRAVGIPARQVYTPRWAHTDNNHAWVEAWVDGEWHFLGACEPEPVLDLAWFNAPASRGMLMHTNAFGSYDGPEEVLSVTPCFTEINVTSNYAPVATTEIKVTDKEGNPVETKRYTPQSFYAEYFGDIDLEKDFVMVMNDPSREYYKVYEIEYDRHVYDGDNWVYLNLPIEEVEKLAIASIKDNTAMYFSCDVGKFLDSKRGTLDIKNYNYGELFGIEFGMDKRERVMTFDSGSSHAMTLKAVDLDKEGNPVKWQVENSWGASSGFHGTLIMTDEWFNEYMFRLVVDKKYIPANILKVLDEKPTMLPAWDPMFMPEE